MNGKIAKQLKKLSESPGVGLLVLIHKVYGEKTKDMDQRKIHQAIKNMYKRGLISLNKPKEKNE